MPIIKKEIALLFPGQGNVAIFEGKIKRIQARDIKKVFRKLKTRLEHFPTFFGVRLMLDLGKLTRFLKNKSIIYYLLPVLN